MILTQFLNCKYPAFSTLMPKRFGIYFTYVLVIPNFLFLFREHVLKKGEAWGAKPKGSIYSHWLIQLSAGSS